HCVGLEKKEQLADLAKFDECCALNIVDMEVSDMHIWPAPLLADPDANSKFWVFLMCDTSDISDLNYLPVHGRFIDLRQTKHDDVVSFIQKGLNPQLGKGIVQLHYLDNISAFVVRMDNDRTYLLQISDLPEADSSRVVRCSVGKGGDYFRVSQKSGNRFEVPWDYVLYHCEPEYEYYKGKQLDDSGQVTAEQIGRTIRRLRASRGYNIAELARRAEMKRPNLSRLEGGKHQPSLPTLERIAAALDVTVAEIVTKRPTII
ncbi:MAG: helix-turn-helix transcriptional regulator, partial [Dehalococcoidia bacterium]